MESKEHTHSQLVLKSFFFNAHVLTKGHFQSLLAVLHCKMRSIFWRWQLEIVWAIIKKCESLLHGCCLIQGLCNWILNSRIRHIFPTAALKDPLTKIQSRGCCWCTLFPKMDHQEKNNKSCQLAKCSKVQNQSFKWCSFMMLLKKYFTLLQATNLFL